MLGRTHELVGLGFGLAVAINADKIGLEKNAVNAVVLTAGSLVGSLLPDIDHTSSIAGKNAFFVSWPIAILNKFFSFLKRHSKGTMRKFWGYIAKMFGHRGICHSGLLWIALLLYSYFYGNMNSYLGILIFGLMVGGISHLCADSLNPSGIPWLLPISAKRFRIAKISTASNAENIFRWVVILLDIALLILFVM